MSWFDSTGFAGFAKSALTNAQKKIDKVLDIEETEVVSPSVPGSSSPASSSPARSSRVATSGGAGAFGAYGVYVPPEAPKTPPTIKRDAEPSREPSSSTTGGEGEGNDWANQSSLWSSWFDFGGKDPRGESDKANESAKGTVVAAQPPARVVKDIDKETKPAAVVVDDRSGRDVQPESRSSDAAFATTESETKQRPTDHQRKSGTTKTRKAKESADAKKAKPAPPKKLGQRLGDAADPGGSATPGERIEEEEEEERATEARLPVAVSAESDLTVDADRARADAQRQRSTQSDLSIRAASSYSSASVTRQEGAVLSSPSSLLATSSTVSIDVGDSLSASACWEVKEGDAEVDAILRLHEEAASSLSSSKVVETILPPLAVDTPFFSPNDGEESDSASVIDPPRVPEPHPISSRSILTTQPSPASQTPLPSVPNEFSSSQDHPPPMVDNDPAFSFDNPVSIPSSLSTTANSSSDQTILQAAHSEQDLTSFSLSHSSLSAAKLTDSSTTEGTLGPDEEEGDEEEEENGEEEDDESMADVENVVAPSADFNVPPSRDASSIAGTGATAVVDPLMSSSVSSITSNVVKDLLGDAMTESVSSSSPATPPLSDLRRESSTDEVSVHPSPPYGNAEKDAAATENDSYDDDDEDPGGSVSDNGKGSYNSSDEINTACTTSDEREETATSSDIEIISNPSILDGDANERRFEVTSPLRSFGPLPHATADSSQDVIFHHQSLLQGFHQRTPSQSSSCSSSTNLDKKKNFQDWNELKIDTKERRACESDSPFESPNFGDSENEDVDAATKNNAASGEEQDVGSSKRRVDSTPTQLESEKSAGSVRQRLKEETEGDGDGGGRRTPRMSRSRKSSERHLSTATLTASSEDKREDEDEGEGGGGECAPPESDAVVRELVKKMKGMAEVIQAREANAFDLSKMNAELTETVTSLRQQLVNANAARDNAASEMDRMTEEFARRLGEAENKLRTTAQDRDAVKRELNQALKDIQSKAALEAIVKEKEDLVQELMDEGRKLSLQLGNANTALRKLRSKEKESEGVSQRRKEKMEAAEKRVEELEGTLEEVERREKTKTSRLEQLEEKAKILESIKFESESQMEDDKEKMESLKVSLEAANQEISSLKSRVIEADSLVAEAEGKAERNAAKAMEKEFERAQETLIGEREALAAALEDLRVHISRQERDMSRREDVLKQELAALQSRLQEADARNEQLVESMGGATLPLLRQIESLKLTMSTQSASWEAVEANLNDRLLESQEQLIASEEKERVVSEELFDLRGRLTAETSKAASLSTEKTLLKTELETLKMKLIVAEEAKSAQALQTSSVKTALSHEINELKIVKLDLENQVQTLSAKVVELEPRHRSVSPPPSPRRSSTPRPFSPPPALMRHPSTSSVGPSTSSVGATYPAPSLYNVVRESGASFQIEEMQSQLKQKDGEICQLQTDIMNLELTRESMASELVELANKNTALEENIKHYPVLKKQHTDMELQYNALLQMFGEKAEEYDELRMDLEHVKTMYKQQIEELIQKESFRR